MANLPVVSRAMLERLPLYLQYLKLIPDITISATRIAKALNLGEVLVRKDLGIVSGTGKPKVGYDVEKLINQLRDFLGYSSNRNAVILGAGRLGSALLDYEGFSDYGMKIVSAFDISVDQPVQSTSGKWIRPMEQLKQICQEYDVKFGILCVPEAKAQCVAEKMIDAGIIAILTFAPTQLRVPKNILVQHENLASALAVLSQHVNSIEKENNQ